MLELLKAFLMLVVLTAGLVVVERYAPFYFPDVLKLMLFVLAFVLGGLIGACGLSYVAVTVSDMVHL